MFPICVQSNKTVVYGFFILMFVFINARGRVNDPNQKILPYVKLLFNFTIYYSIITIIFQSLINSSDLLFDFSRTLYTLVGFANTLLILLFMNTIRKDECLDIFEHLFSLIAILFIAQFAFSTIESYYDFTFVTTDYGNLTPGNIDATNKEFWTNTYNSRSILSLVGINFTNYFHFPFTGLLGQWNFWGSQLPFLNIIFIIMYILTKKRFYMFLLVAIIAATILNTTRISLIAIVVTDLIVYYKLSKKNLNKFVFYFFICLAIIAVYGVDVATDVDDFFSHSNTLVGRSNIYSICMDYLAENPIKILIGHGFDEIEQIGVLMKMTTKSTSFESQFFAVLFTTGIVGLSYFVYLLVKIFMLTKEFLGLNKLINIILFINILLMSLTLNSIFSIAVLPYIVLIYTYNNLSNSMKERPIMIDKIDD